MSYNKQGIGKAVRNASVLYIRGQRNITSREGEHIDGDADKTDAFDAFCASSFTKNVHCDQTLPTVGLNKRLGAQVEIKIE